MKDQTIVDGLLVGRPKIVEQVRRWIRGAFSPYRIRFGNDLEDLEQEVLLEVIQSIRDERFKGQSKLSTYVKSFVHHKAIDRVRVARSRTMVEIEDVELTSESTAFEDLASTERIQMALRIADELPESCRELWRLLLEGKSYREMGEELGLAVGTVRVRMLRCRQKAVKRRRELVS